MTLCVGWALVHFIALIAPGKRHRRPQIPSREWWVQ
jgi:hypothetical protein